MGQFQGYHAFQPLGEATIIAGAAVAPAGVEPVSPNRAGGGAVSYLVSNQSTNDAWLAWGASAAVAQANAVIPAAGTPKPNVTPIPAKSIQVLRFPPDSFFSAITAAGNADICVQQGDGQ